MLKPATCILSAQEDYLIKKAKTSQGWYSSTVVCFHLEPVKRPGNKSSRHMKADSVVSCDWGRSEGV